MDLMDLGWWWLQSSGLQPAACEWWFGFSGD
jgi:hypothetical protein